VQLIRLVRLYVATRLGVVLQETLLARSKLVQVNVLPILLGK
jgi:hypothetical protein